MPLERVRVEIKTDYLDLHRKREKIWSTVGVDQEHRWDTARTQKWRWAWGEGECRPIYPSSGHAPFMDGGLPSDEPGHKAGERNDARKVCDGVGGREPAAKGVPGRPGLASTWDTSQGSL
ncbi:hypothetical protein B0H11DRAFT_1934928 [Mycena galericulata]|nr:hypothetical protein B0H11DRAFT_1934928 [Mycena galericulata]